MNEWFFLRGGFFCKIENEEDFFCVFAFFAFIVFLSIFIYKIFCGEFWVFFFALNGEKRFFLLFRRENFAGPNKFSFFFSVFNVKILGV